MIEKKLKKLGILGIISLLSYTAMVVFSPLAYPGYNWLSMAVSDLSAKGAPSKELASQLNALFGPCGLVSIMAVCVGVAGCKSKVMKIGIFAADNEMLIQSGSVIKNMISVVWSILSFVLLFIGLRWLMAFIPDVYPWSILFICMQISGL